MTQLLWCYVPTKVSSSNICFIFIYVFFSLGGEGHLNFGTGRYMDFIEFRWVLNIYTARAWQSARNAHVICSPSCLQWSGPRQSWSCSKQTSPSFLLTPTTFGQKTRCLGWISRSHFSLVMLTSEVLMLVIERLHQVFNSRVVKTSSLKMLTSAPGSRWICIWRKLCFSTLTCVIHIVYSPPMNALQQTLD